jgi:excisionase family DNA binding protein
VINNDRLLDVTEAAAFLRIKRSTLYGWVHERRIPFRKHGGHLVFWLPDLL